MTTRGFKVADDDGDTVVFHKRSALIGGVVSLLLGGMSISLAVAIFPKSYTVAAIGSVFSGGVCEAVKNRNNHLKNALVCYQAGAKAHGIDDHDCRAFITGENVFDAQVEYND